MDKESYKTVVLENHLIPFVGDTSYLLNIFKVFHVKFDHAVDILAKQNNSNIPLVTEWLKNQTMSDLEIKRILYYIIDSSPGKPNSATLTVKDPNLSPIMELNTIYHSLIGQYQMIKLQS